MALEATTIAIAIAAVAVAIFGAWLSWLTFKRTDQIAYADLLLRLDERARSFDAVHLKLRPGGEWAEGKAEPTSSKEWAEVDAYMGFFERINFLLDQKLIGIAYVDAFYGYRYDNLVGNPVVRSAKLEGAERASWRHFEALGDRLREHRNGRVPS